MEEFAAVFADLEDPRTGNAKRHELLEILLIGLCTVLCGGETCTDMVRFGRAKHTFLEEVLTLRHGIPSHDTFSRVFRLLDPAQFQACFLTFMRRFADAALPRAVRASLLWTVRRSGAPLTEPRPPRPCILSLLGPWSSASCSPKGRSRTSRTRSRRSPSSSKCSASRAWWSPRMPSTASSSHFGGRG